MHALAQLGMSCMPVMGASGTPGGSSAPFLGQQLVAVWICHIGGDGDGGGSGGEGGGGGGEGGMGGVRHAIQALHLQRWQLTTLLKEHQGMHISTCESYGL